MKIKMPTVDYEQWAMRLNSELTTAKNRIAELEAALAATPASAAEAVADYECQNCIGVEGAGCYCQSMGATSPGNLGL